MRTNVQDILRGKVLLIPLAVFSCPYLINLNKKGEMQNIAILRESDIAVVVTQSLREIKLRYDLYRPSTTLNSDEYLCPNKSCKKSCTTKELLKFHFQVAQHDSYETDKVPMKIEKDIVDALCLMPYIENIFERTLEIEYK